MKSMEDCKTSSARKTVERSVASHKKGNFSSTKVPFSCEVPEILKNHRLVTSFGSLATNLRPLTHEECLGNKGLSV